MKVRSELRLIERAIKQGWPVLLEEQDRSLNLLISTLESQRPREVIAALRVLGSLIERGYATDAQIRKRAQDALRKYGGAS